MSKSQTLQQRRRFIQESDIAQTTAEQLQDQPRSEIEAIRQKMNLRLPGRYFTLLDTVSARRASRPSRNALIAEAVEMLLRSEQVL